MCPPSIAALAQLVWNRSCVSWWDFSAVVTYFTSSRSLGFHGTSVSADDAHRVNSCVAMTDGKFTRSDSVDAQSVHAL